MLPPTIHHRAWAERIDCVYYSIREVGLTLIEGQAIRSYSTTVFYSISHRQRLDGYSPPPRLVVHSCERQTSRHTPYCRTKFNPKKKKKIPIPSSSLRGSFNFTSLPNRVRNLRRANHMQTTFAHHRHAQTYIFKPLINLGLHVPPIVRFEGHPALQN